MWESATLNQINLFSYLVSFLTQSGLPRFLGSICQTFPHADMKFLFLAQLCKCSTCGNAFVVLVPVYTIPSSGCSVPLLPLQLAGLAGCRALDELSGFIWVYLG